MVKNILKLFFAFIIITTQFANAQDTGPNMGIIPAPVSLKKTTGEFVLSRETKFLADSPNNKAVVFFADYLRNKKMLNIQPIADSNKNITNCLVLTSAGTDSLPPEGYRLTITLQKITIAGKAAG